ncbi:MAG: hypothetical protein IJ468_14640 [Lachnospiraceae bacterium]|nr:hypothetical protein [Lachnospiraceae bacterium]
MPITEMELQNLRHLIMEHETVSCKMSCYAQDASTPEFKQYFEKAARCADDTRQQLMTFLK